MVTDHKSGFDKAFIIQQIAIHEKALKTIKGTLIPSAKDAEFKAHLEKTPGRDFMTNLQLFTCSRGYLIYKNTNETP